MNTIVFGGCLVVGALIGAPAGAAAQSAFQAQKLYQKAGIGPGDAFGYSAAGVGDIDGDGTPDFVVGAQLEDLTPAANSNEGRIHIYSGATGREIGSRWGLSPNSGLGFAVGAAGDVNLDGRLDFIAGAPSLLNGGAGYAEVLTLDHHNLVSVIYQLNGTDPVGMFGAAVGTVGDMDGAGSPDLIVGAPLQDITGSGGAFWDRGAVHIFSGETGHELYVQYGAKQFVQLGWSVSGAGDINRDGYVDYLGGAPEPEAIGPAGEVYSGFGYVGVFSGKDNKQIMILQGSTYALKASARFGLYVAGGHDMNNDGFPDFLVGAPYEDTRPHQGIQVDVGVARAFSGADYSLLWKHESTEPDDYLGTSICFLGGDIDGDGYEDVIIGSSLDDYNTPTKQLTNCGRAMVCSGKTGATLYDFTANKTNADTNDLLGILACPVGDIDHDGKPDILLGAMQGFPKRPGKLGPPGYIQVWLLK